MNACKLTDTVLSSIKDEANEKITKNKAFRDTFTFLQNMAVNYKITTPQRALKVVFLVLEVLKDRFPVLWEFPEWATKKYLLDIILNTDQNYILYSNVDLNPQINENYNEKELRRDSRRDFLKLSYGRNYMLSKYAQDKMCKYLVDALFINRGSLENTSIRSVEDIKDLNENIRSLQEQLFQNVISYIRTKVNLPEDLRLYDEDGEYTGVLEDASVVELIKNNIGELSDINKIFNELRQPGSIDIKQSSENLDKKNIDAYNSWVALNHFDEYMSLIMDDNISYKVGTIGKFVNENKYAFSGDSQHTYWDNNDDVKIQETTDRATRLLITTTPIVTWDGDKTDRYLDFNDWTHIIASIKTLSFDNLSNVKLLGDTRWNNFSSDDTLHENFSEHTNKILKDRNIETLSLLIGLIPSDGQELLPVLFDILTNKDFYNNNILLYKMFNLDSLSKIRSINEGMFNGSNSLRDLSTARGNYYSYISQSAISIYNNNMFEYYHDRNGVIKVKTLMDNTLRKLQENIRANVNNINSHWLINNWGEYVGDLDMRVNNTIGADEYVSDLRNFLFTIPNTKIEVKVGGDGTVTYINKNSFYRDAIMLFVDSTLGLNLRRNYDLLQVLYENNPDYLNLLLDFASRTTFLKYLQNTAFKNGDNVNTTIKTLQNKFKGISTYYGELSLVHGSDSNTLNMIAEAQGVARGLTTSPLVYDSKNRANSKQSLRTLKASYKEQYELLNKKDNSITKDLLVVNTPGLIKELIKFKEYTDGDYVSKNPVKMSPVELFTANFVYDFIGGIYNTEQDNLIQKGKVLFCSSVNADKSDSSKILTDLSIAPITNNNHPLAQSNPDLVNKPLMNYKRNELITLINHELGGYYRRMIDTVRNDLEKINPLLAQGLESNFAEFNEWVKSNHPETTPSEYLNRLIADFNENHPNDPVELIDVTHYRTLDNGDIASNLVMLALLNKYSTGSEEFWRSKEREMIKLLLDDDFTLNTSNTNLPEFRKLRSLLSNNGWINRSGNMVLCKVKMPDGTFQTIASKLDAEKLWGDDWYDIIGTDPNIRINPYLARYNLLDHLITQEFLNTTVGSFTNHPYKGELHTDIFGRSNLFELEATQQEAQNKRNVSLTTPVIQFLLNELNGIPDEYNIAVIDEYLDTQGNVNGLTSEFNAIDAATFVDPMTTILENNSLGGSKAGVTKKPFITAYNHRTGTGEMYKTAGFGLTNADIRNSPNKLIMMKKMTSREWKDQNGNNWIVDITGRRNRDLKLEVSLGIPYKSIFYSKPIFNEETQKWEEHYYRVKRATNTGDNEYDVYYVRVSENGDDLVNEENEIIEEGVNKGIIINSNYTLWNYFGGKDSMELKNGKLVHSNASVENCVIAANNLGIKLTDGNAKTQSDFYQPLKHSNIHYICTKGAVKQGAANLNPKERFFDDRNLTFSRTKLYNAGIILDKEHDIKEDEVVSISTQAMSSSVLRGRTFNSAYNMYKALGLLSNLNAGDHVEIAKELFKNPNNEEVRQEFDEVFNKSIMQSLLRDSGNYNNFAQILALNIIDRTKREGETSFKYKDLKIPLSDGTIYNRILTSINSYLTSVGIRTKLPGTSAILAPSHNLYKIYAGKKYGEYVNPEEELRVIQENMAPVYLKVINEDGTFNTSISNLPLNRTYNIIKINEDNSIQEETKLIATPNDYIKLKNEITEGKIQSITENVLVGRDLSSYNVKFKTNSGEDFQLYDLDSIHALYELEEINGSEKEKFNKYISLANRWSEIRDGVRYQNILYFDRIMRGEMREGLFNSQSCKEFNSQFYKAARKVLDKWKLFDLNNLSKEVSEDGSWYVGLMLQRTKLINDLQDLKDWYEQYGLKVNIKFGLADGAKLKILNRSNQNVFEVNDENFEEINNQVLRWVDGILKVKISEFDSDGNRITHEHTINKESIDELAYEIIMPLTFGKQFGLTVGSNVSDIVNDNAYFVKQLIDRNSTKTDSKNYTIELKVNSGNHLYIIDKDSINNLTKVDSPLISEEAGSRYKIDLDGNIQYELDSSAELYTDEIGNEIIATNNIKFYIDNQDYYSIKLSKNLVGNEELFKNVLLAMHNSNNDTAYNVANESVKGTNGTRSIIELNNRLNEFTGDPDSFIYKKGMSIYNSFMDALNVIVARTPGQSMQSFMAMKIVAFDDSGTNLAYVSTMQNLLQGSDYDIDTVSIFTYDINRNGTILLWSPYVNLTTTESLKASKRIALPTGLEIKRLKEGDLEDSMYIIENYGDYEGNEGCLKFRHNDDNFIDVIIDTSTPEKVNAFVDLLEDINKGELVKPTDIEGFVEIFNSLFPKKGKNQVKIYGNDLVNQQDVINNIYDLILEIVNKHNMFLVNSSKARRTKIINNYLIYNQLNIIGDTSNLELSQSPTDYITKPLKVIADNTSISRKMRGISSGNVMGKFRSYTQSVVGKEDVGIAAVGMKTFAGLTEYYDYVLNYGTPEQQKKLLSKKHVFNNGKIKRILANAYAVNLNTIKDIDVLRELAETDNMDDAALTLAAIASLAADNAKDLKLGKLNAGTATIGMYLYGVMVGLPFNRISELLTSEAGLQFAKLLQGNVFTDSFGFSTADKVANYFLKYVDSRFLSKYDINRGPDGLPFVKNPLNRFKERVDTITMHEFNYKYPGQLLTLIARSEHDLNWKIDLIDTVRNVDILNTYESELFNLLCDFVEDYINTMDRIRSIGNGKYSDRDIYDLKVLAEGSLEIRELGQMYSTNLRIDTATDKFLNQIDNIKKAEINRIGKKNGANIQVIDFIFDPEYRKEKINQYNNNKHTFNILEAPFAAPHYTAYMESLATALVERMQSSKFRSMLNLLDDIEKLNYSGGKDVAIRGINNYLDDLIRNEWMMQTRLVIRLPKGSKVFTNDGEVVTTGGNTDILLGTDSGNASFRLFMENVIIPDLKNKYPNNNFVQDLLLVSVNRTITRNSVPLYSLGINMMPRGDFENAILDNYKYDFDDNNFSGKYYEIKDPDGNVLLKVLIGDLFTYYSMIAHGWKMNERSLVPILLNYQTNSELSRSYQEFQTACDKLPNSLEYNYSDLVPYIAQVKNPYTSNDPFVYSIDGRTGRYRLMKNMSEDTSNVSDEQIDEANLDSIPSDFGYDEMEYIKNPDIKGDYEFMPLKDIRYFPTGKTRETTRFISDKIIKSGKEYRVKVEYDIGKVEDLKNKDDIKLISKPKIVLPDNKTVSFDDFEGKLPITKKDGFIIIDSEKILNLYLNLC